MKRTNLAKLAIVALAFLALGVMLPVKSASALSCTGGCTGYELDSDVPITIGMDTIVDETATVNTTDVNLGTIGIHQAKSGAGTASITLSTAGVITDTSAQSLANPQTTARIVSEPSGVAPVVGQVAVTAAFPNSLIYEHYENVVDLTCSGGVGTTPCNTAATAQGTYGSSALQAGPYVAPTLHITHIFDDIAAGGTGGTGTAGNGLDSNGAATTTVSGDWTPGSHTDGIAICLVGGTATWDIGITIATVAGIPYYASGVYTGSFDITLSY
jgi:hypothetical protein